MLYEYLYLLELSLVVVFSWFFFRSRWGGQSDPFAAIVPFLAFYSLNYSLRSLDLFAGSNPDHTGVLAGNLSNLMPVAHYSLVGVLCFYVGYVFTRKIPKITNIPFKGGVSISLVRLKILHVILLIISFAAVLVLLLKAGVGPLEYVRNLNYYRLNVNNDVGYLKFLLNLPGLSGILLYAAVCENKKRIPWMLIVLPFMINFFFAHRHFAVYYIFSLMTVRHYLIYRFSLLKVFSFAMTAFLANGIFGAWRDFHYVFPGQELSLKKLLEAYSDNNSFIDVVLYHTYLSGFHGVDSVYKITSAVDDGAGYHYGWRFLVEPIVGAIPYSVWPDKPIPLNTAVNNLINRTPIDFHDPTGPSGGIVGTVLGDLYWAGGIVGIIIGMALIGSIFSICQNLTNKKTAFRIFLYSTYYPVIFMFMSTIGSGIIRLVYFTIFISILYLFVVKRSTHSGVDGRYSGNCCVS
jgi:oligosaccharide repeat unit polymerase